LGVVTLAERSEPSGFARTGWLTLACIKPLKSPPWKQYTAVVRLNFIVGGVLMVEMKSDSNFSADRIISKLSLEPMKRAERLK
jgi:hypothetical protein